MTKQLHIVVVLWGSPAATDNKMTFINLLPAPWSTEELKNQQQQGEGVTWRRMWVTVKPSTLWLCGCCVWTHVRTRQDLYLKSSQKRSAALIEFTGKVIFTSCGLSHSSKECKRFWAINCGCVKSAIFADLCKTCFLTFQNELFMSFCFLWHSQWLGADRHGEQNDFALCVTEVWFNMLYHLYTVSYQSCLSFFSLSLFYINHNKFVYQYFISISFSACHK